MHNECLWVENRRSRICIKIIQEEGSSGSEGVKQVYSRGARLARS